MGSGLHPRVQPVGTTILVVDITRLATDFAGFKKALESLSKEGDYKTVVQHERIFRAMHRI